MSCEYCRQIGGRHDNRCPLAPESRTNHYCSICNQGIQNGEEYIKNDDCEYAHWECVDYTRDLIEFLGYDVKKMEDYKM
ncbi:MAG: hypothetical protein IJA10_10540 [Lachnospiraceae bacterium]|nr:hypothetical protein [Lachnospiraceae bacterium]